MERYQYAVICLDGECGLVELDQEEYLTQLCNADITWECPLCHGPASWDDDSLETSGGITEEEYYSDEYLEEFLDGDFSDLDYDD